MSRNLWYVRNRNKVTGPFDVTQLDALRRRGQLARFHEISEDRQTWASAMTLSQLFASTSPQMSPAAVSLESPTIQRPLPCWYYSLGKSPVGPISVQQLFELMQDGRINADTLIWKDGLPAWLPLRDAQLDHAAENHQATSGAVPTGASVISPDESSRTRRKRLAASVTASGSSGFLKRAARSRIVKAYVACAVIVILTLSAIVLAMSPHSRDVFVNTIMLAVVALLGCVVALIACVVIVSPLMTFALPIILSRYNYLSMARWLILGLFFGILSIIDLFLIYDQSLYYKYETFYRVVSLCCPYLMSFTLGSIVAAAFFPKSQTASA